MKQLIVSERVKTEAVFLIITNGTILVYDLKHNALNNKHANIILIKLINNFHINAAKQNVYWFKMT